MLPKIIMTRKKTGDRKVGGLSCFSKSESAAATAIAAVLLLALVFTMIAVVKLEHVPDWKNDAERDHMYNTLDDMVGVKTSIDILSGLLGPYNFSSHNISVTVPVDMGGGEIPFLEPSKSDGKLEVNTGRYEMTIVPRSPSQTIMPYTLEFKGITCYSENKQYPNQIFRYENGALILADDKGSAMRCPPSFIIKENKTNTSNCTVIIQAVQLTGKQDSVSSNTIIPLELTGYGTESAFNSDDYKNAGTIINAFNLTIATRYPGAWTAYLNETAQDQGLDYGKDYIVQYLKGSGHVRFSFLPSGNKTLEGLYVNKTIVGVEIGSGDNFDYNYSPGLVEKVKKLYNFSTVSSTEVNLSYLSDYNSSSGVDFSTQSRGETLNGYLPSNSSSYYSHNLNNNPLNLTFGFNNSTKLEPNPHSSITLIMIYQPTFNNPTYQSMTIAGKELPGMTGSSQDTWFLYNQTVSDISVSDPSNLTFNLQIKEENKNGRSINIDYLAIYLS